MTAQHIDTEKLASMAQTARSKAVAPYSHYQVGAALLTTSGNIYTAGNIESSSYGLTMCAERVALFSALANGVREFAGIAIATDNGASPCGACRQLLWEYLGDVPIILTDTESNITTFPLSDLLPEPFDGTKLSPESPME